MIEQKLFLKLLLYKPKATWHVNIEHYTPKCLGLFLRAFVATAPTYSKVLNSSTFPKEWVTSRIWNESQAWSWMGMKHRDGDKAQKELLWLCTWTHLAPCSSSGGNQPQSCPSCKTLNWLDAMKQILQERCWQSSSPWCFLYAKDPCGFKHIFCLRSPQGWEHFPGRPGTHGHPELPVLSAPFLV